MEIVARRIDVRERRGVSFAIAVVMGLATVGVLMRMISPHEWVDVSRYWSFGLTSMLWNLALLLPRKPAPKVVKVRVADGVIYFGDDEYHSISTLSVNVARGEAGYSIAIGAGDAYGWFLEVSREADARRLLEQLGVGWPGTDGVTIRQPNEKMWWTRAFAAALGGLSGFLYAFVCGGLGDSSWKGVFGLPALCLGVLASFLFLLEPLFRRTILIGNDQLEGSSALAQHVRLHRWHPVPRSEAMSPSSSSSSSSASDLALDHRDDETTRAWLARIDALGAGGEGYRGGALTAEELVRIAEDKSAQTTARLAALRVLARKPGGVPPPVRVQVDADLGAARTRVVVDGEDASQAADDLDAIGPVFRARS